MEKKYLPVPIIENKNSPSQGFLCVLHTIFPSEPLLCHKWDNLIEFFSDEDISFKIMFIVLSMSNLCYQSALSQAIEDYPDTCAVLVRRHGVYVWGESWQKCKTM